MDFNLEQSIERIRKSLTEKKGDSLKKTNKLFVRSRINLLLDRESFIEDGLFAHATDENFPCDGVVTGLGKIHGYQVGIIANDSLVKAGSWGALTVEKILRLQELCIKHSFPIIYLIDSAGARITDQIDMFPGRRGAGRIFYYQAQMSGKIPQLCILFGPSAAGGAYIPAFCDIVIMVEKNASMYLGSPRMVESVIGEKISLEDLGGTDVHCKKSGVSDLRAASEEEAIELVKKYFLISRKPYTNVDCILPTISLDKINIPKNSLEPYDMLECIGAIIDKDSFLELKKEYAPEIITGFATLGGKKIAIVANQPKIKGGVLFYESAYKASRFIQLANCYDIPLLFLVDVPGFMVGSKVEEQGIIRAGARMIHALSLATVPKISLILRKAFGAGLYAMSGPAFGSDAVLCLDTAEIAVMGPQAAINAVYFHTLNEMTHENEKKKFIDEKIKEYTTDINIKTLASKLIIDDIIPKKNVRNNLIIRFDYYSQMEQKKENQNQKFLLPM